MKIKLYSKIARLLTRLEYYISCLIGDIFCRVSDSKIFKPLVLYSYLEDLMTIVPYGGDNNNSTVLKCSVNANVKYRSLV